LRVSGCILHSHVLDGWLDSRSQYTHPSQQQEHSLSLNLEPRSSPPAAEFSRGSAHRHSPKPTSGLSAVWPRLGSGQLQTKRSKRGNPSKIGTSAATPRHHPGSTASTCIVLALYAKRPKSTVLLAQAKHRGWISTFDKRPRTLPPTGSRAR
jgi:hypothetical protein